MTHDPIVDEVRAIREQLAAKFDFDIRRIIADAQARQSWSGSRLVSFHADQSERRENATKQENGITVTPAI